jgi:small subunit ribosomal protein S21
MGRGHGPCKAPDRKAARVGCKPIGALGVAIRRKVCHIPRPLPNPTEPVQCKPLEVQVGDKGIERAIKHLKRKMAAEGILRELKRRRHYMKPSVKRRKKMSEAARRRRKRQKADEIPRTAGG